MCALATLHDIVVLLGGQATDHSVRIRQQAVSSNGLAVIGTCMLSVVEGDKHLS